MYWSAAVESAANAVNVASISCTCSYLTLSPFVVPAPSPVNLNPDSGKLPVTVVSPLLARLFVRAV
jgi:hypothetical protein